MARLKRKKIYKDCFLGVRCTQEEFNELKLKANLYSDGNMSEYALHAILNYEVVYADLEDDELDELIKRSAKAQFTSLTKK